MSIAHKLKDARTRLQNGDFIGATYLCEELLKRAPRNPDALWLLGAARLMSGNPREAVPVLERAVRARPDHCAAADCLGLALLTLGDFVQAETVLRRASATSRAPAIVHMRLGLALLNQAKYPDAITELQRALDLDPGSIDARLNLGQAYGRAGDRAGAQRVFESIIADVPGHADALYNLGVLFLEHGELEPARASFEKTLAHAPQHPEALVNLGVVLQKLDRLDEAAALLRRALIHVPLAPQALTHLGAVLVRKGEIGQARQHFTEALRLDPGLAAAREGLAALHVRAGRHPEAVRELLELVHLEPSNSAAHTTLATALLQCGAVDAAERAASAAWTLAPHTPGAYSVLAQIHLVRGALDKAAASLAEGLAASGGETLLGMLVHVLRRQCDWEPWQPVSKRLAEAVERGAIVGSPFYLLCEETTPDAQLAHARKWATARFGAISKTGAAPLRRQHSRLRIGYLSSDFQQHPVGYLLIEALELHDRDRVEVFAYSYGPEDDSVMRARFAASVEHFVDIARQSDDEAAARISNDELDVLVDLKGYTLGDRLSIMARRPCAVQAAWLGYPGTTGAPFIDYLIADPFLIPSGAEQDYSEQILRLPHCYQPNDTKRSVAEPRERGDYGLPDGAFVFCCFNQTVKITPAMFSRWMALLRRVPDSVLWLLEDNRWATQNLAAATADAGIGDERLIFASRVPHAEHLARYDAADLALDTFPYTSHTTASEALWMGCPLIALCGESFAARVSSSILTSCGLPQLIAHNEDDYEALAISLASDDRRMSEVRADLAAAKEKAPLFDTRSFTRALEDLYRSIG